MKNFKINFTQFVTFVLVLGFLQSCIFINNDGLLEPKNPDTKTLNLRDFDRLEMESAFRVRVQQGSQFKVVAYGDRRDVSDLDAFVDRSGKLVIRYKNWRSRRYEMEIDITMPTLKEIDFSGAVNADIEGFSGARDMEIELSGASKANIDGDWERTDIDLSGASKLTLRGQGASLVGDLSGASTLEAFDYPVDYVDLELSGASDARVLVDKTLIVKASGASALRYRGRPDVRPDLSGGSTVKPD